MGIGNVARKENGKIEAGMRSVNLFKQRKIKEYLQRGMNLSQAKSTFKNTYER